MTAEQRFEKYKEEFIAFSSAYNTELQQTDWQEMASFSNRLYLLRIRQKSVIAHSKMMDLIADLPELPEIPGPQK